MPYRRTWCLEFLTNPVDFYLPKRSGASCQSPWIVRPPALVAPFGEHRKEREDAPDIPRPFTSSALRIGAHFAVFEHRQRAEDLPPFGHVCERRWARCHEGTARSSKLRK